jgi:hypothetical protein
MIPLPRVVPLLTSSDSSNNGRSTAMRLAFETGPLPRPTGCVVLSGAKPWRRFEFVCSGLPRERRRSSLPRNLHIIQTWTFRSNIQRPMTVPKAGATTPGAPGIAGVSEIPLSAIQAENLTSKASSINSRTTAVYHNNENPFFFVAIRKRREAELVELVLLMPLLE